MALNSIITNLVTDTVRSTVKFDFAVNDLLSKFEDKCPPREELERIIKQKQALDNNASHIQNNISSFNNTTSDIRNIIRTLKSTVNVILNIPIPTSVPPGAGIPVNFITRLVDTLKDTKDNLTQNENLISVSGNSLDILSSSLNNIKSKLNSLDSKIYNCLQELINTMTEEEKLKFIDKFNIDVNKVNNPPIDGGNLIDDISSNQFDYKGFKFEIQSDNQPGIIISRKRILAINLSTGQKYVGEWSYSSGVQVLIDEMKYTIDNHLVSIDPNGPTLQKEKS